MVWPVDKHGTRLFARQLLLGCDSNRVRRARLFYHNRSSMATNRGKVVLLNDFSGYEETKHRLRWPRTPFVTVLSRSTLERKASCEGQD